MRIKVERKHIDNGRPFNPEQCAIALAVKSQTRKRVVSVRLGSKVIVGNGWESPLDADVVAFAEAFDRREPVQPFEFELAI